MTPIFVGVSSSLSAETTSDQFINEVRVPTSSVYHERDSEDNFASSDWESPANVLVIREDIEIAQDEEIGSNTEDAFSDWLRSHSESGPAEAAVDSVSIFGSGSASLGPDFDDYDVVPQRPRGPMPSNRVSVPTSPCRLFSPPPLVAPYILAHEISSIISYSRSPPSATSIFSQSADNFSSPAIQSAHEVESKDDVAIPTPESLARVFDAQDNKVVDVASSTEVFADDVGERAFATWPSLYFKYDTGEDSKELYSAVQSNPVPAKSDSNDEYEVLAAPASSHVHMAEIGSVCEESNLSSDPSLFNGHLEPHVLTPLSRDPQPSSLLESPSSSFVSVTSLSILPSALSVSSSSMSVPSSSLSSFHSSSCLSPASSALFHDQVPLSRSVSVLFPFTSVSDDSFLSSSPAAVPHEADVACTCRLDVAEPPPILCPPEDPPPDILDELRNWLHAYAVLGIEECSPLSFGNLPSLPNTFDDMPDCPAPSNDFSVELRMTLSPAAQATAAGPAIPTASGLLPTPSSSGNFSGFLAPTNGFEEDALPISNIVEDSSFCSYDSCNMFPTPRNNDERGLESLGSLGSVVPSSSFDDVRPTLGYVENLLLPATGLEIDTFSLCSRGLHNVAHGSRSDSVLPARVDTLDLTLGPEFV